jgi:hypothetical protein
MIKLKVEIKKPARSVRQLFNYRLPLLLTYKAPRIYGWLFWNFELIEPATIETHSYCEAWTATSVSLWHIRRLTSVGKKLSGGADTKSLCGREMSWDRAPVVTKNPPLDSICPKCQEAWERERRV